MARSPTVLLLIDFMNFMDFGTARKLAPHALRAARRTRELKLRLQRSGVHTIYANDNFGRWESDFAAIIETCISRGGASRKLVELIAPAPRDRSVLKPRHSAFFGTPLEFLLDDLGARRLIITGIATDSCVMFTASDAFVRGYPIWVPSDCVAAANRQFSRTALAHMARVSKASIVPSSTPLNVAFKARAQ